MTLFCILLGMICVLTIPRMALVDLGRIGATERFTFDIRDFASAVAIGASLMILAGALSDLPGLSRLVLVILGSLLTISAWIDRVSAWAPDILILPLCMALFLVSPDTRTMADVGTAVGFGALLFIGALAAWFLQDRVGYRFAPPPDIVALAAPLILFGISMPTSIVYAVISTLLIAASKSTMLRRLFSRPEAIEDAGIEVGYGGAKSVTFLSIAFPVVLVAQALVLANTL